VKLSQQFKQKFSQKFSEKKARKWMWAALAAFLALQIYFVQEMLAALILFTGVFVVVALIAFVMYLVDQASKWSLEWVGQHVGPAIQLLRRGWTFAEELSKKPFRRPRSETAQ
jgi:uncharacterized membrane protein YesL